MLKKLSTIFLLILSLTNICIAQDTLYFDTEWNPTIKSNHAFYRPLPLQKIGNLVLLKDFYKNGNLQMQGYVFADHQDRYVGDVYYYDQNGYDLAQRQYFNHSDVKELSYYHDDGSIWQKIAYNKNGTKATIKTFLHGKEIATAHINDQDIVTGTFSHKDIIFHYESFYPEEVTAEYIPNPPTLIESTPVLEEITSPAVPDEKDRKSTPSYFINTYWFNGNLAHQEKIIYSAYFGKDSKDEKFYNENGKLVSEIIPEQKSEQIKFTYYTKNNIAQKIKESTTYIQDDLYGDNIIYDPEGNIISKKKYKENELIEEQLFEQGRLLHTNLYKNFKPYDGTFTDEYMGVIQYFVMKNGQKIGEEKTLMRNDSTEVAKGSYNNGECWNGTFLVIDKEYDSINLFSYKDGKLDGTQKVYVNAYLENLQEEYQASNGVKNGFRKIYDQDTIIAESIYENDKIISGTVIEDGRIITYKNGVITHEKQGVNSYDGSMTEETFFGNNGQLEKIVYYDFTIEENPQNSYTGIYKNEKPYDGYFKIDSIIDNIKIVSYFEKGELKQQYSFDFIEQMENYDHYIYTDKATFSDNKIISGNMYELLSNQALIKRKYSNGVLSQFDINLFGMHFFSRLSFEKKDNKIYITQYGNTGRIEISAKNDHYIASYYDNDKLKMQTPEKILVEEKSPNSITVYYEENDIIKKLSRITQQGISDDNNELHFYNNIFTIFPLPVKENLDDIFLKLSNIFNTENNEEDIDSMFFKPFESYNLFPDYQYLSFIQYDHKANIPYGIRLSEQTDKSILVEGILDNEIKETIKVKSIAELIANDKKILEDLSYRLLNKY